VTVTPPAETPPPSRPLGVAILAILIGLFGFLWFVIGLLIVAGVSIHAFTGLGVSGAFGPTTGLIAGVIILVVGLIVLGVAVGLWRLHVWALVLAILVLLLEMVVYGLAGDFVSFGFIVSLLLFLYLLAVHRHFF
jgi:hypothetical protein